MHIRVFHLEYNMARRMSSIKIKLMILNFKFLVMILLAKFTREAYVSWRHHWDQWTNIQFIETISIIQKLHLRLFSDLKKKFKFVYLSISCIPLKDLFESPTYIWKKIPELPNLWERFFKVIWDNCLTYQIIQRAIPIYFRQVYR